jgi:hypothetical protein
MGHIVTSRLSILSSKLDAAFLGEQFPWRVIEATAPNDKLEFFCTLFDLGVGQHDRVDNHLAAVKRAMLAHELNFDVFSGDCKYVLWISYQFPMEEGAFNVYPSVSAAFALLRVELVFRLKPVISP